MSTVVLLTPRLALCTIWLPQSTHRTLRLMHTLSWPRFFLHRSMESKMSSLAGTSSAGRGEQAIGQVGLDGGRFRRPGLDGSRFGD